MQTLKEPTFQYSKAFKKSAEFKEIYLTEKTYLCYSRI